VLGGPSIFLFSRSPIGVTVFVMSPTSIQTSLQFVASSVRIVFLTLYLHSVCGTPRGNRGAQFRTSGRDPSRSAGNRNA
jgi:hypothetical protein